MPSTTSSWVSSPRASSTVITPSLPTFSIASAMISPIVESLLAEMVPTCAISLRSLVGLDRFLSSPVIASTARLIPRFSDIGSWPAATLLIPSVKIGRASTVAVVVPSPATSEVLEATSFTICAPMFSNLSSSSNLLGDGHTVLGYCGGAEALLKHYVTSLGPERHRHRVGQDVDPLQDSFSRVLRETYNFGRHSSFPLLSSSKVFCWIERPHMSV